MYYHTQEFGALAMGIANITLQLARIFLVPTAKRIGKELLIEAAPEFIDIASRKRRNEP